MAASQQRTFFSKKTCIFMGVTLFLTLISFQGVGAMRPLQGDLWFKKNLIIQSLPKGGPVGNPSSNPCTFIPGTSHGRCTLAQNEANSGARAAAGNAPQAIPEVMVQSGTASKQHGPDPDHSKKDQSSS